MHELTHLIDIPFGVIIMTLFLILFLICFNVFLFYKWSCSVEELKQLENDVLDTFYSRQCERG